MHPTTELMLNPARGMSLWAIDDQLQYLMEKAQEEEEGPCSGCEGRGMIAVPGGGPLTCPECAGKGCGVVSVATMQALQLYFQTAIQKVDRIAGFLRLEKVLEPAYKAEKQRLEQRWRVYQNQFQRCKDMLLEFLRARDLPKIKGATNTISRQNNSIASLEIPDATKIPIAYQRMTITIKASFWDYLMNSYKDAPDCMIELRRVFDSLTDISAETFVDEKAVRAALTAGLEVTGAELKFGEHIRVR